MAKPKKRVVANLRSPFPQIGPIYLTFPENPSRALGIKALILWSAWESYKVRQLLTTFPQQWSHADTHPCREVGTVTRDRTSRGYPSARSATVPMWWDLIKLSLSEFRIDLQSQINSVSATSYLPRTLEPHGSNIILQTALTTRRISLSVGLQWGQREIEGVLSCPPWQDQGYIHPPMACQDTQSSTVAWKTPSKPHHCM